MAEQLVFEQRFGQAGAVYGHEKKRRTAGQIMYSARGKFLASLANMIIGESFFQ